MTLSSCGAAFLAILLLPTFTLGQSSQAPSAAPTNVPSIVQATLVAPGSTPFHLKATITERGDPTYAARVEIFWLAPDKWRRTIQSQEFSQTLIVNGDKVFEQDSDDSFPSP
jgi:outer membrane lipoprotein-sorting protein